MVKSIQLSLYLEEGFKHKRQPLYEWIIECAKTLHIPGCSCFRSFLGYGKHQHMHSEGFFELQGKEIISMMFILSEQQLKGFFDKLKAEKISCFYTCMEVESGVL